MAQDLSPLDRLTVLVPPPATPVFGTRDWDEVFADLGLRLPADYVAFLERYGSCEFARWLSIKDDRALTHEQCVLAPEWMDHYRDLRGDYPEDFPLAMWPEPGGFFPWGSTIDGDYLGWMTVGTPEEWPVALIIDDHEAQEHLFRETMTEWLVGWASGARFDSSGFARGAEGHPLVCEPW
ncbi:SMI1/KNR4 family protein [Microbispora sp. H13382]|uniref:SMI1/KNR4 family protein n=1 Tax=Microbispora sp. H13382 TaxID=2729112 RepID=UPI0015FED3BC|nr:SMI1/KNR4 family protein [Microbispora sp. H13382]